MAERANVTSIETLEIFRTSLIIYVSKMESALNEIGEEVRRTRQWIESDRRRHWENELRRRQRKLDQAEQELYSASLASMSESHARQKMGVARAKRAKEEAEQKLRVIKKWCRDFDGVVEPRAKKLEMLRSFMGLEMAKAIAYQTEMLKALESYADVRPASGSDTSIAQDGESGGEEAQS